MGRIPIASAKTLLSVALRVDPSLNLWAILFCDVFKSLLEGQFSVIGKKNRIFDDFGGNFGYF